MRRLSISLLSFFFSMPAAKAEEEAADAEARPHFGFEIAAGLPDALSLSLIGRPWTFLELRAGGAYNIAGFGIQGGITLAPFDYLLRPSLNIEGGHFFPGDGNKVAGMIDSGFSSPLLKQLTYSWASAHVGVDIGIDQFRFFIRAGMSYVRAPVTLEALGSEAVLTGFLPSAKLGFTSILL